jgi:hypothetical protein
VRKRGVDKICRSPRIQIIENALMAKLADAMGLGSIRKRCRFKSYLA